MANQFFSQQRFQGFADYIKEGQQDTYYFAQAIDYRNDPQSVTLLPGALKESGNIVTDLLKWADTTPNDLSVYSYGDSGNLYKRTAAGSWSLNHQVANSHGNGLAYFYGDDYLYYTGDSALGRLGPISGTASYVDDFLSAQGGVPTNTYSLSLTAASSQYADRADSVSLSIISDICLEAFFKATTLPTVGNTMTLIGKWDESGALRSYKMDISAVSGYFGDGSDGAKTVSVDETDAPIDSACTGTIGTYALSATNASFAAGQVIFIHQTQGTGAGIWQRTKIQTYTAGTITTTDPLNATYTTAARTIPIAPFSYTGGAQVMVLKQYTNFTINSSKTLTVKAWNGVTGGNLGFLVNGTFTNNGTITGTGKGFRSATMYNPTISAATYTGEGTVGPPVSQQANNGNGGGGAVYGEAFPIGYAAGAGGGNGTAGQNGAVCVGGIAVGTTDLTTMELGGAGGSTDSHGAGGAGGANIFISASTFTNASTIASNGNDAEATGVAGGGGGGGAGGSILIKSQVATLGTGIITANAGVGTVQSGGATGKTGGVGRIHLDYYTSYTGTTTPTVNVTQDNTLVTNTSYQARIGVSSNGTANEHLAKVINITTAMWYRLSISWRASTSTATFYLNGVNVGTTVGTITAINDNATRFAVGANKNGAGAYANFFNGLVDDVRVWAKTRSDSDISTNSTVQLIGNEAGLSGYWQFNNAYTDLTANANTLTSSGSPVFTTDVPFSGSTTRLDIDQSYTTGGSTYTTPTTITETAVNMLSFAPSYDPQKSVDFNFGTKGTGNVTVTVHDQQNNTIASLTVTNANLPSSGWYEFKWTTPWRIVTNKTYHMHVTSTVADATLVSNVLNDLSTGNFHTYFGFLVSDTAFHPVTPFLNKMIIGNERYIATWDGALYQANALVFPPLTHVRCFAFWRDYIAIGVWKEATSGTPNIYDWSSGKIYFWDGISLTYNFSIDVPEGQINAMFGNNTTLFMFAGWRGDLMKYEGGYVMRTGSSQSAKLKPIPKRAPADYVEIYPGAMNMWRGILHFGTAANSNSTTISRGVYAWGTLNILYPESLSLDYPISTMSTGNTVSIGLVYPIGQSLLVGWKDNVSYGCDKVNFSNPYASYGTMELLIRDNGAIWKEKSPMKARIDHLPLATGESVYAKYKIDRASVYTTANSLTDIEKMSTVNDIQAGRGREYQIGFDIYSTNGTTPTILGVSLLYDDLASENQL